MHESQAAHTGTSQRTTTVPPRATAALCGLVMVVTALVGTPTHAVAQIQGRQVVAPTPKWWMSGGASASTINAIADGASNTRWRLEGDPRWQFRGALERALDVQTAIGVAVGYGNVDVDVERLDPTRLELVAACGTACQATADMWSVLAQFHSGGGTRFHGVLEGSAGVLGMRNLRTRDDQVALADPKGTWDLMASLGGGFAFPFGADAQVTLVQEFGIGWHSGTNLPAGTTRTWRIRTTRAGLRFGFGTLR